MRVFPLALLLAACGPLGEGRTPTTPGDQTCPNPDWMVASSADMTFLSMVIGAESFFPDYDDGAVYPGYGPAACFDPASDEVVFVFENNGEAMGSLLVNAPVAGNIDLADPQGAYFTLRIFPAGGGGSGTPPTGTEVVITQSDVVSGSWVVETTDPLAFSLQGQTTGAQTFIVNLSGELSR